LVLVDSLAAWGPTQTTDGLLGGSFRKSYHEPYYRSYLDEDFAALAARMGLVHVRKRERIHFESNGCLISGRRTQPSAGNLECQGRRGGSTSALATVESRKGLKRVRSETTPVQTTLRRSECEVTHGRQAQPIICAFGWEGA